MSPTRPAQAAATAAAVLVTALLAWGAFVPPALAAACDGTAGVTVVADFTALGGGVEVRCAPGDPESGLAALTGAGFSYTFAAKQPGYVCRVNGQPASDPCMNTSPADAYWGYWHAHRGGDWVYSNEGAGTFDPPPGSVEGWAFGAGEEPRTPPPAAAPKATPRPGTTVAPAPRATAAAPVKTSSPPSSTSAAVSGGSPSTTARPATASVQSGAPAAATPATPAATPVASESGRPTPSGLAQPAAVGGGQGTGLPLVLGLLAIVGLAASTVGTVLRRRRSGA